MNIRSLSMERSFSTLLDQSRIVPTLLFRGPESISYGTEEEAQSSNVIEMWPEEDGDDSNQYQDQLVELQEFSTATPACTLPSNYTA